MDCWRDPLLLRFQLCNSTWGSGNQTWVEILVKFYLNFARVNFSRKSISNVLVDFSTFAGVLWVGGVYCSKEPKCLKWYSVCPGPRVCHILVCRYVLGPSFNVRVRASSPDSSSSSLVTLNSSTGWGIIRVWNTGLKLCGKLDTLLRSLLTKVTQRGYFNNSCGNRTRVQWH